jgi:hypothetical protein
MRHLPAFKYFLKRLLVIFETINLLKMNCKLILVLIGLWISLISNVVAQNVAINATGAVGAASSMLDVSATDKGVLVPRVSLVAVNNAVLPINAPAASLLVYNTNAAVVGGSGAGFYYWDGAQWVRMQASNSNDWNLLGNAGTTPAANFLGTTDNQSLVFRTNNAERVRVLNTGEVGIGTPTPIQNLDVNGRINVQNGVIQRGTTQITATTDLGLYQQNAGSWIRVASNAAPIKFFVDQGGANSAGTNAVMAVDNANGGGVMIAAEITGTGNAVSPFSRAALELNSTTKGMLTTRMTTVQRDAMGGTLTEGLLIYNTTNDCFEYWDTQATPVVGSNGFWNSLCDHCDNVVIISANQTGFNLNTYVGGGRAETYCVYVQAGVTLQAAGNGGGSGAAGNSGFNASTMPSGAKIILYNYGNILAGGGNGGVGARESDAVCQGDVGAGSGGAGGHAILTSATVPVAVNNYGIVRAGGGGGGGAGAGCCSAGGGGGGGAGTPAGAGGAGACYNCTGGFICGCGNRTGCSGAGANGTATTSGVGGAGAGSSGSGCSGNSNGGTGATGGGNGIAGSAQGTGCCSGGCGGAGGGAAGLALNGSGSGSTMNNISGTVTGAVTP